MRHWLSAVGVAAVSVWYGPLAVGQDPTRPPPFADRVEMVERGALVAYGRSLVFDTSFGVSDVRHLTWSEDGKVVLGPIAQLAPERGAHLVLRAQLAQGRILGRVRTSGAVRGLGLPQGESYLWADSVEGAFRWVVIPVNADEPLRAMPLHIETHRPPLPGPRRGGARFFVGMTGALIQVDCETGCCCTDPTPSCEPIPPLISDLLRTGRLPDVRWPRVTTIPMRPGRPE
jgi:hypothetical protein